MNDDPHVEHKKMLDERAEDRQAAKTMKSLGIFRVAGVKFSQYRQIVDRCRVGDECKFVAVTDNPHDSLAIKIELLGVSIGWVPAKTDIQFEMHYAHKQGHKLVGRLYEFNPNSAVWNIFHMEAFTL